MSETRVGRFSRSLPVATQPRSSPRPLHDDPQGQRQNEVSLTTRCCCRCDFPADASFRWQVGQTPRWRKTARTRSKREF
ncbi:MAG: hypothetical protein H0Z34_15485 [Brevibacillus sp.]|nr:hypothetical protein [Brevibacillus sp.]